ncbi:MAG: type I restriction enzyme S subunit, partial [Sulfurimonas sp.]
MDRVLKEELGVKKSAVSLLFESIRLEKQKLICEKIIMDKKDKHVYPVINTPFNIPNNWMWCYLSDISIIQEGPGIRKYQYTSDGVQFLTVTNILEGFVDLNKSKKYISVDDYNDKYSHFTINKGDIVTACSGGSWGKSAIYNFDDNIILNTSTLRLRFFNDLGDNKYLYYLTKTTYFKLNLSSHSTGQQPNYGYSHYSKIPIPLPSLQEQQRIVAILDEAFSAIEKAKANAQLNLKNAKELFENYLQSVFENKGDDWEEKKWGELCHFVRGPFGGSLKKS